MGGSNCSKIGREKTFVRSSTNALHDELCCTSKHRSYADHASSVLRNGLGPRGLGFGFEAMGMMRDKGLIHENDTIHGSMTSPRQVCQWNAKFDLDMLDA
jgi:hypothetical protein